ncbi:MAG: hypothetical protein CBD27_01980 [Rhodospirillaceae bacterium TMED167]|nr:hypothetical protein [Rhodospirillaceae bacterium]OUW30260.1 MAG: hypothetical protein CBD27_01980 [Rhodospirillaceae bacterium TMED167]
MGRLFYSLLAVISVYGGLVTLMFLFQRGLMYHPSANLMLPADHGVPEMRQVTLNTEDGLVLTAWYRPSKKGRHTLMFLHGNGGHIGHRSGKVKPYLNAGYGVLLVSYRGYGANPGTPTEENLIKDGRAGLRFLKKIGVQIDQIVLYGESLGTGVATALAQRKPVRALILEAPFTSIADVSQHRYFYLPARYLVKDRFDSAERITRLQAPLLIIHGEKDRVVPWKFGRALFDLAPEPKSFLSMPNASHNNLYEFGVASKVIDFITKNKDRPLNNRL